MTIKMVGNAPSTNGMSPEELFDKATRLFNDGRRIEAGKLFKLLCGLSNRRLYLACTNAVYIRMTICNWGHRGTGYAMDMRTIAEVTLMEKMAYRLEVQYLIHDDGGGGNLVVIDGNEGAMRGVYSPVVGDDGGPGNSGITDEMKRMNGMG